MVYQRYRNKINRFFFFILVTHANIDSVVICDPSYNKLTISNDKRMFFWGIIMPSYPVLHRLASAWLIITYEYRKKKRKEKRNSKSSMSFFKE